MGQTSNADNPSACLSSTGAIWISPPDSSVFAQGLVDAMGMPLALATALGGRDISKANIDSWLAPKLRDVMPDPSILTDMDKAASRLVDAVNNGETIGVFGDYDVDGASSAAIIHDILTALGCKVQIHIPDRFTEGYGPNLPALKKLKSQGCTLILTVDCGITAHAPIAAATDMGAEIIIIDHHIAGPDLPRASAVVNPNRLDDDGSIGYLAAAGVSFLVMVALLRALRNSNFFSDREEPDLKQCLDLVALATICDVVPLIGLNRAFVCSGLKIMGQRRRLGLAALADIGGLNHAPDPYALGYIMGPRINAGGRLGAAPLGVRLLTTTSTDEARQLAKELNTLNTQRRDIEKDIAQQAIAEIEESHPHPFLMVKDTAFHQGVIGIVAGRLKDHFNKPVAVVSLSKDDNGRMIGKGSARSVSPFRLGSALIAAEQAGLLLAGGGHHMAAGFTLDMNNEQEFQAFMNERVLKDFGQEAGDTSQPVERRIDSNLALKAVNFDLLDWLDRLEPFGVGFPKPRFRISGVSFNHIQYMGAEKAHMSLKLRDATGGINGVAFRVGGTPLGMALEKAKGNGNYSILGRLNRNEYQGRISPQFLIDDIMPE